MPTNIPIHAPREGCDRPGPGVRTPGEQQFQSTLPVRGATLARFKLFQEQVFQSTLPVRGATNHNKKVSICNLNFNPRSP